MVVREKFADASLLNMDLGDWFNGKFGDVELLSPLSGDAPPRNALYICAEVMLQVDVADELC